MRILFVDQFSEPGGGQGALLDLLPAVGERGWAAHVALPSGGPLADRVRALGATVDTIHCGSYCSGRKSAADSLRFAWNLPRLTREIARLVRTYQADLVYVNGPRVLPAAALTARKRMPLVFHCHGRIFQPAAARLAGQALRLANGTLVTHCRFAAEPLVRYVDPKRYEVVYYGVAECPPVRPARPPGAWRIGLIGRISPEKGQAEFLQAARLLVQDVPTCTFVICGAPLFSDAAALRYNQRIRELAAGLPAEFLGWRDDVYSVLSSLDLLVVPSVNEPGSTRVILEAYAAGVPVVAFPSGGIPEILEDGRTGFLVRPATPEALARSCLDLLLGPASRLKEAAEAGRSAWRERFTLARYQRTMLEVIERALR
jgi:glycosyltransferase involved in cell wall biosynthesis